VKGDGAFEARQNPSHRRIARPLFQGPPNWAYVGPIVMTKPVPRPSRKPPAYPTLAACLVGTVSLVGCKGNPPEAAAGGLQPIYGLGGATTSPGAGAGEATPASGSSASSTVPLPAEKTGGVPPPTFVEPEVAPSAASESVPPKAASEPLRQPHQPMPGGKSPARVQVPKAPPVQKTAGKPMPPRNDEPF
jgi:hypothetical protein